MTDNSANPLDFENKLYDIEEFGAALRSKFEADNSIQMSYQQKYFFQNIQYIHVK